MVLTLGTKHVIAEDPQWWRDFLAENVSVLAMNEEEALALTGVADPLLASDKALDWVDLVLCTAGPARLYMAGYSEKEFMRETTHPLLRARWRSLTVMNSAAQCVRKIVRMRRGSIPISNLIWVARIR